MFACVTAISASWRIEDSVVGKVSFPIKALQGAPQVHKELRSFTAAAVTDILSYQRFLRKMSVEASRRTRSVHSVLNNSWDGRNRQPSVPLKVLCEAQQNG